MLEHPHALDDTALRAIAALEDRCVATDGGRLKLEWGNLRSSGRRENDLLWWDGGALIGFCGRYAHGGVPEIAGMVDPAHRRRGIGGGLLDTMLASCAARGDRRVLLIAPRACAAGQALATSRGGTFHHAEHALELTRLVDDGAPAAGLTLRRAGAGDVRAVGALLSDGFGGAPTVVELDEREPTLVAERDGAVVATLRETRDADGGRGIYGFVVTAPLRGQGIGRAILQRVCAAALRDGAPRVHLEVEVDNDRALGLYTSVGFEQLVTEDYFALATG